MDNCAEKPIDSEIMPDNQNVPDGKRRVLRRIMRVIYATLALLLVCGAIFFALFYRHQDSITYLGKQFEFIGVMVSLFLLWVISLIYFLIDNRKIFWSVSGYSVGAVVLFLLLFEFREMDGDMIPRFGFRLIPSHSEQLSSMESSQNPSPESPAPGGFDNNDAFAYYQFQGPGRDSILNNVPEIASDWQVATPEIQWSRPVGEGYSGFVVAAGRAFSHAQSLENPENESIFCLDFTTGQEIWSHEYPARYESGLGGVGPRATPVIHESRVYFLGATGVLTCVDTQSGDMHWTIDITERFSARIPEWGFAGSPLVYNGQLIIAPGGVKKNASVAALDPDSGETLWQAGNNNVSWSSPTIVNLLDSTFLMHLHAKGVELRHPEDGQLAHEFPWGSNFPQIAIPVTFGNDGLIVSSGYGVGAALIRLNPSNPPETVWKTRRLKSKFAPMIPLESGLIAALNDGILIGLDPESGDRVFQGERYGHGQMLRIGPAQLLIQSEKGSLHLVDVTRDGEKELGRFPVFDTKTWNPPALSSHYVLMRNHRMMARVKLPLAAEQGDE